MTPPTRRHGDIGADFAQRTVAFYASAYGGITLARLRALPRGSVFPCTDCGAMYDVPCACAARVHVAQGLLNSWSSQGRSHFSGTEFMSMIADTLRHQYNVAIDGKHRVLHVPCPILGCDAEPFERCRYGDDGATKFIPHMARDQVAVGYVARLWETRQP